MGYERITLANYMRVAQTFDNHDSAHLLDAYLAGLTCETLEFLNEAEKMSRASMYFDIISFAYESGDMLWNMAMLLAWWGYDFDAPELAGEGQYAIVVRQVRSMHSAMLVDNIKANLSLMMNTRERMLRNGSTTDHTDTLKTTLIRMYYAWRELNMRAGLTGDSIADSNVRKLCKVYERDYDQLADQF